MHVFPAGWPRDLAYLFHEHLPLCLVRAAECAVAEGRVAVPPPASGSLVVGDSLPHVLALVDVENLPGDLPLTPDDIDTGHRGQSGRRKLPVWR